MGGWGCALICIGDIDHLMAHAVYDKLDDGTYSGRIPQCTGVVAFGTALHECKDELHSTLED